MKNIYGSNYSGFIRPVLTGLAVSVAIASAAAYLLQKLIVWVTAG